MRHELQLNFDCVEVLDSCRNGLYLGAGEVDKTDEKNTENHQLAIQSKNALQMFCMIAV